MFEQLVWSLIEQYAQRFLKDFSPGDQQIDLWNGRLVLEDLELDIEVCTTSFVLYPSSNEIWVGAQHAGSPSPRSLWQGEADHS